MLGRLHKINLRAFKENYHKVLGEKLSGARELENPKENYLAAQIAMRAA